MGVMTGRWTWQERAGRDRSGKLGVGESERLGMEEVSDAIGSVCASGASFDTLMGSVAGGIEGRSGGGIAPLPDATGVSCSM